MKSGVLERVIRFHFLGLWGSSHWARALLSILAYLSTPSRNKKGWQKIEDVEDFVKSDATDFHSGHLKRKTLTRMEKNGKIAVERPLGRRGFTPGTRILFR